MSARDKPTAQNGLAYERFMGRWSRLTGRLFVDWLRIPPRQRWLEVGCGTGAFTEVILSSCDPAVILAFDPSEPQIAQARSRIPDKRVTIRIGNAISIGAANNEFDVAAAALALNFIADQRKAAAEMARVVRPGGTVAAYVWNFAGRQHITQHLSDAMAAVAPEMELAARTAQQADTTSSEALARLFRSAGLAGVETKSLDITAEFNDFEDYWTSNMTLITPISVIGMTGRSLTAGQIQALQQKLRETLPMDKNGKITFTARAWAVRGMVRSE